MTLKGDITIELIERRADLPLSPQQWNGLVAAAATNTVFQTYEWFDVWWQAFGRAHQLFFLLLRQRGEVIGFAPLMLRRLRFGMRQIEFVGTGNADYQDFVLPPDAAQALAAICAFLRAHARRWHRVRLCNIPDRSPTLRHLRPASVAANLHVVDEARVRCPSLVLERHQPAAWELINKYSLRRPFNWFARRGAVRFRHVTSAQEIQALLPVFFDQHKRRWRAAGGQSLFESEEQRGFYVLLAQAMHASGWLSFSVVEFNGVPIAFHFGFDYMRDVIWYKPSFEIRYAERSPGLLLIRQLIENALQRERREIDFTIGEESFKARFANVERQNEYVGIYHRRLASAAAVLVRDGRRALGRLKRTVQARATRLLRTAAAATRADRSLR